MSRKKPSPKEIEAALIGMAAIKNETKQREICGLTRKNKIFGGIKKMEKTDTKGMSRQELSDAVGAQMERSAARRDGLNRKSKPVTEVPEGSRNAAILGLQVRPEHEIGRT